MIRNDLRLPVPVHVPHDVEVFAQLDVSPFEFFLAGSRYMGCAREDSDWDFITQASPSVHEFLEKLGFASMSKDYEGEKGNTVSVMQFHNAVTNLTVQVHLCRSAHWKRAVRDIIKDHMLAEYIKMGKTQRAGVWDELYYTLSQTAYTAYSEPTPF